MDAGDAFVVLQATEGVDQAGEDIAHAVGGDVSGDGGAGAVLTVSFAVHRAFTALLAAKATAVVDGGLGCFSHGSPGRGLPPRRRGGRAPHGPPRVACPHVGGGRGSWRA